jgi:hypothetical protein
MNNQLQLQSPIRISMRHVRRTHIGVWTGTKSMFLSRDEREVEDLIRQAINNADVQLHHYDPSKWVLSKRFNNQIGKHGYTGNPCYRVIAIYNWRTRTIITAYPVL